jgi:hypothetical protein
VGHLASHPKWGTRLSNERSRVKILSPTTFQSAPYLLAAVGTWGGFPGEENTGEKSQEGHTTESQKSLNLSIT